MKEYNLHIVRSPLQLINILEAIGSLSLENNILLILDRKNESNTKQIQEVLSIIDYKWAKVFHIEKKGKSNLFKYVKLIKEIKRLPFKNIFIGDIDSISNVIISNIDFQKVYLVDDGTSTLIRHGEYLKDKKPTFKEKSKLFRFNLFGLKSFKKYKINFFSFFDLKQKKDEEILKNEFNTISTQFKMENNFSEKVYFLGQPIYNKEIKETVFLNYLEKVLEYYSEKELVYLKHRYEEPTEKIKELLKKYNVVIEQNKYPIELEFLIRKEYPKYITGFFSTAIYTLSRMFKDSDVKAFYINKDEFFNEDRAEVVEDYYGFFRNSGISIIE